MTLAELNFIHDLLKREEERTRADRLTAKKACDQYMETHIYQDEKSTRLDEAYHAAWEKWDMARDTLNRFEAIEWKSE